MRAEPEGIGFLYSSRYVKAALDHSSALPSRSRR